MSTYSRDLEDRVVSVVERNLGDRHPDRVPWHVVLTTLASHASYDVDAVWDALDAAVDDGRLSYDEESREFWIPE